MWSKIDYAVTEAVKGVGKGMGFLTIFYPWLLLMNYLGTLESFDLPSLNWKQALGISLLAAIVAS